MLRARAHQRHASVAAHTCKVLATRLTPYLRWVPSAQPFTLPEYYAVIGARALLLNTALLTVPFQPGNAREMWPTALQAAVHLLLLAHAPRQSRLMRARWQAQTAAAARLHGD